MKNGVLRHRRLTVIAMEKSFSEHCKPNTKEFWQNVWFYYRIHIIVGIIVLILIGYTVNEIAARKDPDFAFMYVGGQTLVNEEETQKFFEKYATDTNGDGTVYANVLNIALGEGDNAQYTSALIQKADVTIAADENPFILLVDEDNIERYTNMEAFEPIGEILKKYGADENKMLFNEDKKPICLDVTGTKFTEKIGYNGSKKVYLGLQFKRQNMKDDKDYLKLYTEAERMLGVIIGGEF